MRFIAFTLPNPDLERWPNARWVDFPMAVLEDAVCSRQEEMDRVLFGRLICEQEWEGRS